MIIISYAKTSKRSEVVFNDLYWSFFNSSKLKNNIYNHLPNLSVKNKIMNFDNYDIYLFTPSFDNESILSDDFISLKEKQDEISQNFDLDFIYTRLFEIRKEANTERTTNKLISNKKVKKNLK